MPKTEQISIVNYESLFRHIQRKSGLILPLDSIVDEDIDGILCEYIEDFDSIEAISYSSFLNAIAQTHEASDTVKFGWKELKYCRLINNNNNQAGIVFHRDNLLYIIAQIIKKEKGGNVHITGSNSVCGAADYYKSLLLINNKTALIPSVDTLKHLLRNNFIRDYPYYYLPDIVEKIYKLRFQRYWYIYNVLMEGLDYNKINYVKNGMDSITKEFNLSIKEYFSTVYKIFNWFVIFPNYRRKPVSNSSIKGGFYIENTGSYYIHKQNFGIDYGVIKFIDKMSRSIVELKEAIQKKRRDTITGFYKDFQLFFDYPIFKIDDDTFCIFDLKFLFEGVCAGFIWRINEITTQNLQNIKEQYGYLVEVYFVDLLKKIFFDFKVQTFSSTGSPDAVIETSSHILVFEFTVEYYRFASLYSETLELFEQDVYRILFNEGIEDPNSRGKKDRGKFHKLNGYLEEYKSTNKTLIPILVMENYLGDFEILEQFDSQISEKINEKNLDNLKVNKPLIICLDDLEIYWSQSKSENSTPKFIDLVERWTSLEVKGPYHFNFSYFMSEMCHENKANKNFKEFFNWKEFVANLTTT